MKDKKGSVQSLTDAPEELENKEWVAGNLFSSLNPMTQPEAVAVPSAAKGMTRAMLLQLTTRERAEYLASHAELGSQMLGALAQVRSSLSYRATLSTPPAVVLCSP
jgi:hypothetical protein